MNRENGLLLIRQIVHDDLAKGGKGFPQPLSDCPEVAQEDIRDRFVSSSLFYILFNI